MSNKTTFKQVMENAPRGFQDSEDEALVFWVNDSTYWENEDPATFWDKFEDALAGVWNSETDFAEQMADDCGWLRDEDVARYFDVEAFARDLFMGDYWSERLPDDSLVVFRAY
jgi:antirestriction protein